MFADSTQNGAEGGEVSVSHRIEQQPLDAVDVSGKYPGD
jgi:hypothetical protein